MCVDSASRHASDFLPASIHRKVLSNEYFCIICRSTREIVIIYRPMNLLFERDTVIYRDYSIAGTICSVSVIGSYRSTAVPH